MVRALAMLLVAACSAARDPRTVVTISASDVGAEGRVLAAQLARFMDDNPDVRVVLQPTPDAADQRHQLYVQWLNAGAGDPDVLQLDVIWTPEFAAAGWIQELDADPGAFFPRMLDAASWRGRLYAVPWFADVGMLYYRTDLVSAPRTFDELVAMAEDARRRGVRWGYVWQGQRYEGLVTTYLEVLGGFGGAIARGDEITVDSDEGTRALAFLASLLERGVTPCDCLTFTEEETRFAFQNGDAAFMRNWPYALALLEDPESSSVAGRVGVAPMPAAPGGRPTAALGGGQLAVNAKSDAPEASGRLIAYLTSPEAMRERAAAAGQYPTRPALYDEALRASVGVDPTALRAIVEAAEPRPPLPVYSELSDALQIELHRALAEGKPPARALADAAARMRRAAAALEEEPPRSRAGPAMVAAVLLLAAGALTIALVRRRRRALAPYLVGEEAREARLAWGFVLPALACILLVAVFPLVWTIWESLHHHDLRTPWRGRQFVGLSNYVEALGDGRFWGAVRHTAFFTAVAVALELLLGLVLALALDRAFRGRGLARAAVLVPWALPTVVAALVFRFLFDAPGGVAWLAGAKTAWVPVILADVWKTTPFVALLLLAGLQGIDASLYEAVRVDGAGAWKTFTQVTLPLLRPTIVVALLFRVLDAFRVFDLVYVLTGGGPGTATEPLAVYTFQTLLGSLRFGYGAALSVIVFLAAFAVAAFFVRALGADLGQGGLK